MLATISCRRIYSFILVAVCHSMLDIESSWCVSWVLKYAIKWKPFPKSKICFKW